MIEILSAPSTENPFLVLRKPRGLPSAPLFDGDKSAFTEACKIFPDLLCVKGRKEIEHGLVHRIDNETDGILLIASTQESYDFFVELQKQGKFIKHYKALCRHDENCRVQLGGFPSESPELVENSKIKISSMFRYYKEKNSQVRPVTDISGKAAEKKSTGKIYSTEICIHKKNEFYAAECSISNGFKHQVRSTLCWCGYPISGDPVYSSDESDFKFFASGLEFIHPLSGEYLTFSLDDIGI